MLSKYNTSAWIVFYLCLPGLFQKHILVWFSNAFLEQWDTAILCIFTTVSITKETNPHTSTVKNLTALSLQDQVHVVTATECTGQRYWTDTLGLKLLFLFYMQLFDDDEKRYAKVWGLKCLLSWCHKCSFKNSSGTVMKARFFEEGTF